MGLSRQEVNLRRLLAKSELLAKGKDRDEERLAKSVKTLEEMLRDVAESADVSNYAATLTEYERRVHHLRLVLGLTQLDFEHRAVKIVQGPRTKLDYRDELLGETGVRQRGGQQQKQAEARAEDLDKVIDFHQKRQDRIANEMLTLTRSLKEQSELANRIIRKDTETVGQSMQLTERNFSKLKEESETLQEHSRRSCKCWMWIILLTVMAVFVFMVMFMKVTRK